MNRRFLITASCALLLLAASQYSADAEFPKGAYTVSQLEEACAEAAKARKPIALFVSDSANNGRNITTMQETAMRRFKTYAVVIFVEQEKNEKVLLPPPAYNILHDPETFGKYYPHGKLCTPDFVDEWGTITMASLKASTAAKTLKAIEEESKERMSLWKPGEGMDELLRRQFRWFRTDGKLYDGKFRRLDADRFHVTGPRGQKWSYARSSFTPASLAFAKKLAVHSVVSSFEVETWTSSDGRPLEAKFVALEGSTVLLERDGSKHVRVASERLDEASREKANSYAEKLRKAAE